MVTRRVKHLNWDKKVKEYDRKYGLFEPAIPKILLPAAKLPPAVAKIEDEFDRYLADNESK